MVFPDLAVRSVRPVDYANDVAVAPRTLSARTIEAGEPLLSADERAFLDWLFAAAGLDVGRYKPETLKRRLPACLRVVRAADLADARLRIHHTPRLHRAALSALVIGVTGFFRDPPVFSALVSRFPELMPGYAGRLRVWSAGCSDGAELYSIAALLAELRFLDRSDLLGTDCRADAVDRARAGSFDAHLTTGVPADVLARYFTAAAADGHVAGRTDDPRVVVEGPRRAGRDRRGAVFGSPADRPPTVAARTNGPHRLRWVVGPALRAATQWRTADVLSVREPGPWDVVLCRNLAIYLQPAAAAVLWRQLAVAVRPGGLLVLGKAERPGDDGRHFTPAGPCLYRRTGAADETCRDITCGGTDANGVADVA